MYPDQGMEYIKINVGEQLFVGSQRGEVDVSKACDRTSHVMALSFRLVAQRGDTGGHRCAAAPPVHRRCERVVKYVCNQTVRCLQRRGPRASLSVAPRVRGGGKIALASRA